MSLEKALSGLHMMEWFKNNSWALVIAFITIVATYTLYGYRLDQAEKRLDSDEVRITAIEASNNATAVALGKIQTDIDYIKIQLDRIFPPINK